MPDQRARAAFPTTRITLIEAARGKPTSQARDALSVLCSAYWYPIYASIRRLGYRQEDAEDLTQSFFARVLEKQLRPFPAADSRWQISTAGGHRPRWRRDGRELFFLSADGHLMEVDAQAGSQFQSGVPRILFSMRQADEYEVRAEGQQFLVKTREEDRARTGLHVVINWTEELRRESARR